MSEMLSESFVPDLGLVVLLTGAAPRSERVEVQWK